MPATKTRLLFLSLWVDTSVNHAEFFGTLVSNPFLSSAHKREPTKGATHPPIKRALFHGSSGVRRAWFPQILPHIYLRTRAYGRASLQGCFALCRPDPSSKAKAQVPRSPPPGKKARKLLYHTQSSTGKKTLQSRSSCRTFLRFNANTRY